MCGLTHTCGRASRACGSGRQLRPKFSFPTQLILLLHYITYVYSRKHPSTSCTRLLGNSFTTPTLYLRFLDHWTLVARGDCNPFPSTSDVSSSLLTIRPSARYSTPDLAHIQARHTHFRRRDSPIQQRHSLLLPQHHQVGGDSISFAGAPFARTALVRLWRRHQAAAIIWST
jgi:hypothetical protein